MYHRLDQKLVYNIVYVKENCAGLKQQKFSD